MSKLKEDERRYNYKYFNGFHRAKKNEVKERRNGSEEIS